MHLVYASTSAHDPPRCVWGGWCTCMYVCGGGLVYVHVCVCGGVGVCACMCVWAHAQKPVNMCVWVCISANACAHACRRLCECGVFVFQCVSVSLCFV